MEACQHQQKKDTHLKDGLRGSSGGTQITSTTKYITVGNQTIYAHWEIITYQVTYNANNGTGAPGVQTKTWGQTLQLSSTKPTRSGYTFVNWNTKADGTGTNYIPGASYIANAGVTLYAKWKPLAVTTIKASNYGESVNYSANGVTDWKVFLNDGANIYIIAGDYVPRSGMILGTGVSIGNGNYCVKGNSRDGLISWLQNTSYWTKYAGGMAGATATGGPTLSQFVKSYNQKMGKNYSDSIGQGDGFINNVTNSLYNPHVSSIWNSCYNYWIASISTSSSSWIWAFSCDSNQFYRNDYNDARNGIRPLICLPSGIYAKKENNKWTFSK